MEKMIQRLSKIFLLICVASTSMHIGAMDGDRAGNNNGTRADIALPYTSILESHRGYTDYIPMDIAYIPSLFSVKHQMAKYGIAKPTELEGTGYEYQQLSQKVFDDVTAILDELDFDYSNIYILKLNPQLRGNATTIIVTNSCLFVDEDAWQSFYSSEGRAYIQKLAQDNKWDVEDPVHTMKKYVLHRGIAHYKNGSYRKKVASKILIGAAVSFIVYKAMTQVKESASNTDQELGITQAICSTVPTVAHVCSKLWIPSLLKGAASMVVSSIIGSKVGSVLHRFTTKPFWNHLDRQAEHEAVSQEPIDIQKLLKKYNELQADAKAKQSNFVLHNEYARRAEYIASLTNAHQ